MPLHECPHTFEELAATVLPAHMSRMRVSLADPREMEVFAEPGVGVKTLLKNFGLPQDFSGCYVLLDKDSPIYVGISRGVIGRLRQHVFGKTHFDASLAFRIAMAKHPDRTIAKLTRSEAMEDPLFGTSFMEAQVYLRSLQVAAIAIENALELYVFEPYCAVDLDTHQWNSFETH
ncbi:excinuclease ABC subunit C [Pseudomonas frederiksbergensis]|uniref:Excinuclease ABC subunit C n=1 Tax=Pseudomonas frederiksbergensis TaxID=104087 RepID=A0A1J0EF24_9PSED|nr:GIY-YIG nuclease family protein [Pseudomonas frederiksbergensis]APC14649.1 excinuclease ABC subunit C [Pseudomonas frederiksbergensis]